MLRQGDILNGKYEILKLVGTGGMSKVWLAMDRNVNRQWAVKEISKTDPSYRLTVNEEKTLAEIEIMRKLDHPAIPRIVDIIDEEYSLYVIRDFVEGDTLEDILENYGVQKEEVIVTWMLEVCDILTYLHSQDPPIIYRDIKPSNLMLNKDGHIKIIDFGIAREYTGRKADTMPLGTKGYASPEHFTKHTDERSDIFTVGATAYQLLTGKNPQDPPYTIQPIRKVDPKLSQGLEKVILKATAPNPDDRYQTARELANALESYKKLDDEYIEKLRKKVRRHRAKIIASVLVIVAGLILSVAGFAIDRHSYAVLVESPGGTLAAKEKSLEKAIGINPKNEEAYIALIQAYADDGKFTESESASFFEVYNAHARSIPPDVSFSIGEAYLRYYTGETDNSPRAKLLTAEPFFKASAGGEPASAAESYVFLAECYRNYVMSDDSLLAGDVSREDLEEMLESGVKAAETAENGKLGQIVGEAVLNLIELEKSDFIDKGISENEVISAIDSIGKAVPDLEALASETKKSVHTSYENKKKGGSADA